MKGKTMMICSRSSDCPVPSHDCSHRTPHEKISSCLGEKVRKRHIGHICVYGMKEDRSGYDWELLKCEEV